MMTPAQWFEKKGTEKGIEKGAKRGIERGIEKGIQQGRQEISREFAPHLLSKGMPREDVAEMTNLLLAEIDKLIN